MKFPDATRIIEFGLVLEAMWESGRTLVNGYAEDTSKPLPPLPAWTELPVEAQSAFGLLTQDAAHQMMKAVVGISVRVSQMEQEQREG